MKPSPDTSSFALRRHLESYGFKVTTIGVAGDKLIAYVPSRVKDAEKHLAKNCLGQWQTYPVHVKRMASPKPAKEGGAK